MTELEAALTKYAEAKALAESNLEEVPRNVRPGRESQKREAAEALEGLRDTYGEALRKVTFGISVNGPGTETFVQKAVEEAEVIVVAADALYRRIADRVAPTIGNGEFGVSQYSAVIQEMRTIGGEMNVVSMPSPRWSEPVNVGDYNGLLKHITGMVDSSVGTDLTALFVNRQILDSALKAGVNRNTVPVVITGLTQGAEPQFLTKAFQPGRNAVVRTTEEAITTEYVLEVFNNIKKTLKSLKTTAAPKTNTKQTQE
jgi:hypothetical protein